MDFSAHANDGCLHPQVGSTQYSGKADRVGGANTSEDINCVPEEKVRIVSSHKQDAKPI